MRFTIETILSIPSDGASCHLIKFDNSIRILLDCGISPTFDFTKYFQKSEDLKNVSLVLISHSQLEYSGALAFLIDEFGISPKKFYTTQAIMRYSPLNLHEQLLNIRNKNYNKKTFNKIYKIYEDINIIKPLQKKCVNLTPESEKKKSQMDVEQLKQTTIDQAQKIIYFTCYCAGSNMGSVAWRLSFGIVNLLYLVEYNNYSLYHINGINIQQISSSTDVLITDTYENINDSWNKKSYLHKEIKQILFRFYQNNNQSFQKPNIPFNPDIQNRIVLCCYPNEMLVEVMAVVKKLVEQFQPLQIRQKIKVIHLSNRFLQLIKSQMDYFSLQFKDTLQNTEQFFMHSKQLNGRINITTFQCLQGILLNSINQKPVQIYYFGSKQKAEQLPKIRLKAQQNIMKLKILSVQQKLLHSASKIDIQNQQVQVKEFNMQNQKKDDSQGMSQKEQTISELRDQQDIVRQVQNQQPSMHSKYFSQFGFPKFISISRQDQAIYDDYGCRHKYLRFQQRKMTEDYKRDIDFPYNETSLQKKNSTIEIMNIQFKIPSTSLSLNLQKIRFRPYYSYRTNFNSSIQMISVLKPAYAILINSESQELLNQYKKVFKQIQKTSHRSINIYELAKRKYCHLELSNQLIAYKVNYIPIPQERKLQKVKGLITYSQNGLLYIHLDVLEQKQILDFRLDKFYRKVKTEQNLQCIFTQNGLVINGIKIYREQKRIILQGYYSQQYFKVRRLLYDFLKMQ